MHHVGHRSFHKFSYIYKYARSLRTPSWYTGKTGLVVTQSKNWCHYNKIINRGENIQDRHRYESCPRQSTELSEKNRVHLVPFISIYNRDFSVSSLHHISCSYEVWHDQDPKFRSCIFQHSNSRRC